MGQRFGKSDDDRSGVYNQRTDEEVDLFWASTPAPSTANTSCVEDAEVDLFWSWKPGPSTTKTSREPYEEVDLFWSYTPRPSTTNKSCEGDEEVDLFWSKTPDPSTANASSEGDEEVDLFWTLRDETPEVMAVPADRNRDDEIPVQNVPQEILENLETLSPESSVSQSEERLDHTEKPSVVILDEIPVQDVTHELPENLETLTNEIPVQDVTHELLENLETLPSEKPSVVILDEIPVQDVTHELLENLETRPSESSVIQSMEMQEDKKKSSVVIQDEIPGQDVFPELPETSPNESSVIQSMEMQEDKKKSSVVIQDEIPGQDVFPELPETSPNESSVIQSMEMQEDKKKSSVVIHDEIPGQDVFPELLETYPNESSVSQAEEKLEDKKKSSVVIQDEIPELDPFQEHLKDLENYFSDSATSEVEDVMEDDDSVIIQEINGKEYDIGYMLGKGGYGYVFEGTRIQDGLKVAVKVVEKTQNVIKQYINIPGRRKPLPREVGLHMLACKGENVPVIIQFLDWQDFSKDYLVVLERPYPCEDILHFMDHTGGSVKENVAQIILRQATEAAEICCQRGVFHRDIKLENLLINPITLEVKIIDFGCGELYKGSAYRDYNGTRNYVCPEYYKRGYYYAKPATVYSLGVLLYSMLCGTFPSCLSLRLIKEKTWSKDGLTEECCDLVRACLQEEPEERIHLEKIRDHKWFPHNDPADGLRTPGTSFRLSEEEMEEDEKSSVFIQQINGRQYEIARKLHESVFGNIFEGTRAEDGLTVAVKLVEKTKEIMEDYINIPGHPEPLPRQLGLHMLACEGENVPVIVKFLDWQDYSDHYLMVLERPSPCEDVNSFVKRTGGSVKENVAQFILRQVTEAAEICCRRGVFHRDIKLEHLLINPITLEVKIIGFGCGDLYKESAYTEYMGTEKYICPEFLETGEYHGKPATVYSLGMLLYAMLCGKFPGSLNLERIGEKIWYKDGLTKKCCDLIQACLQENPEERIELAKILDHKWFQDNDSADGLHTPDTSLSPSEEEMEDDEKSSVFIQGRERRGTATHRRARAKGNLNAPQGASEGEPQRTAGRERRGTSTHRRARAKGNLNAPQGASEGEPQRTAGRGRGTSTHRRARAKGNLNAPQGASEGEPQRTAGRERRGTSTHRRARAKGNLNAPQGASEGEPQRTAGRERMGKPQRTAGRQRRGTSKHRRARAKGVTSAHSRARAKGNRTAGRERRGTAPQGASEGEPYRRARAKGNRTAGRERRGTAPQGASEGEPHGRARAKGNRTARAKGNRTAGRERRGTAGRERRGTARQGASEGEPQGASEGEPQGASEGEPRRTAGRELRGTSTHRRARAKGNLDAPQGAS
ncbi:Serine/threonine-protein kinase pim-2 [Triplophysa tibetana]|uniref:non-specific serine/threonine protein kinase n=1 Tax=Triplophysa tibetana TaxID=1572043 RepID=A0A5A9PCN3_9TELE|nr:Serine/threonine-protein kinase pim-2 [Triplophysa tibetana]